MDSREANESLIANRRQGVSSVDGAEVSLGACHFEAEAPYTLSEGDVFLQSDVVD